MAWNTLFEEELEKDGSFLAQYTGSLVQNWYFAYKIKQHLPNASSQILEAGAGRGYLAIYFSYLGHKVVATDIDTRFMEKANSFFKANISILNQEIRVYPCANSPHFNLIYNIGVMEHFQDEDIIKICKNFRDSSDIFIFAVPNFKIPYSYGDERYLSKRHWRKLLERAGWRVEEIFSYNRYDLLRNYFTGFVCKHLS